LQKLPFDRGHDNSFFFALPEVGDQLCLGQRASIFEQLKLNIPLTPALLTKIIEAVWQLTFSSSQNLPPAPVNIPGTQLQKIG
jgi:hypothetical protein